jgi:hypothetical protein
MSPSPYRGGITGRRGGYERAAIDPRSGGSHGKFTPDSRSERSEEESVPTGNAAKRAEVICRSHSASLVAGASQGHAEASLAVCLVFRRQKQRPALYQ